MDTSSPLGAAIVTIISAVAQLERDTIAERVRAGLRRVLQRWEDLALEVNVSDRGTLIDIDTPEDLARLKESIRSG